MKKLYEKSEIWFAVVWIIAYCVLMTLGDNLSATVGIEFVCTLPLMIVLSIILFLFVKKNGLFEKYGLCKSKIPAKKMLFYIPIVILLTANLWYGVVMLLSPIETALYVLSMLCVGFLEEMIFRGFLFNAMAKDGIKTAIIVSSITFGAGHIIRSFNGSGDELFVNILQVIYAVAIGFMFVMIYYRTKSLILCIATHSIFNALSAFSNEAVITDERRIISAVFLVVVSGGYAIYIALSMKKDKK